jgi:hypothetical protein
MKEDMPNETIKRFIDIMLIKLGISKRWTPETYWNSLPPRLIILTESVCDTPKLELLLLLRNTNTNYYQKVLVHV